MKGSEFLESFLNLKIFIVFKKAVGLVCTIIIYHNVANDRNHAETLTGPVSEARSDSVCLYQLEL